MNSKIITSIALPIVALVALTGCQTENKVKADDQPKHHHSQQADPTPTPESDTDTAADTDTDAVVDNADPENFKVGDAIDIADWTVKVTKVNPNADAVIAETNMFNDPPKQHYVLVTYDATYHGAEHNGDPTMDLTWTLVTSDGKVHDQSYSVTPADDEGWPTEARNGGTIKVQVLFDVASLDGALLSVEGYDADFNESYADIAL